MTCATAAGKPAAPTAPDWRESCACTPGIQAFASGCPRVFRPEFLPAAGDTGSTFALRTGAPLNPFYHIRQLANAGCRDRGTPNNDTLDSIAWLAFNAGPSLLSLPGVGARCSTMEMAPLDPDDFADVGRRTTGTKAGHYTITGPNGKGAVAHLEPPGVKHGAPVSPTFAGMLTNGRQSSAVLSHQPDVADCRGPAAAPPSTRTARARAAPCGFLIRSRN